MSRELEAKTPGNIVDTPAAKLHAALDLMELAINLMRQNLVRRSPHAPQETIDADLQLWILGSDLSHHRRELP